MKKATKTLIGLNALAKYEVILATTNKGANTWAEFVKEITTRDNKVIVKRSQGIYRLGVEYNSMKSVIEKKGETTTATSLRFTPMAHADNDNILFENDITKVLYIRLYRPSTDFRAYAKTVYEYEGKTYTYEEIVALNIVAPSKLRSSNNGEVIPCFTVALNNIRQINVVRFE